MRIGVPKEVTPGERRVAMAPDVVKKLVASGNEVVIEQGAGLAAAYRDSDFEAAGAKIEPDYKKVWDSDIVLKVQKPGERPDGTDELSLVKEGSLYIGFRNNFV